MDPVTLIFLVAAIIVALKLRSVLGQSEDDGDDRPPMDGYGPRHKGDQNAQQKGDTSDNVVTLPTRTTDIPQQHKVSKPVNISDQISKIAKEGSELAISLKSINDSDPNFAPDTFLEGAKTAYEMIVMAFAEGNKKMLKRLLGKEVFEGFAKAIEIREKKQLIVDSSFIGIEKATIVGAEMRNGRTARITVKFASTLITATHNRKGDVIEGDPKKVREVTDIWTFARDKNARDPNWELVATEAAN